GLAARLHLPGEDRARSVGNVGLAAAELLEAAARAGDPDRHADLPALFLLEVLGDRFAHRVDRARAVELYHLLRQHRGGQGARQAENRETAEKPRYHLASSLCGHWAAGRLGGQ